MAEKTFRVDPRSGFTLIEIVVVLTIISILSSIAMVNYRSVQYKAEAARIATQLHYIEDGIIEAILYGAEIQDFNQITAQNVEQSVLDDFLTPANFADLPEGFEISLRPQFASASNDPGAFWVYIEIESTGGDQRILEELNGMFPPHTTDLEIEEFWIAIDSRTLHLVPDGGN